MPEDYCQLGYVVNVIEKGKATNCKYWREYDDTLINVWNNSMISEVLRKPSTLSLTALVGCKPFLLTSMILSYSLPDIPGIDNCFWQSEISEQSKSNGRIEDE